MARNESELAIRGKWWLSIWENPIKIDDLGEPPFSGNLHMRKMVVFHGETWWQKFSKNMPVEWDFMALLFGQSQMGRTFARNSY